MVVNKCKDQVYTYGTRGEEHIEMSSAIEHTIQFWMVTVNWLMTAHPLSALNWDNKYINILFLYSLLPQSKHVWSIIHNNSHRNGLWQFKRKENYRQCNVTLGRMLSSVENSYMMPSWKQKAPGLNSRNVRMSLKNSHLGFHDFLYWTYLCRICTLVSIRELLQRFASDLLGKNCNLYSPIGAWLVINLVMYAHSELDRLKCFSQDLPLE